MATENKKLSRQFTHFSRHLIWHILRLLRATFCNHRESPDNFNFFESLIISPKIPFDELLLTNIVKTSGDIYFFKNVRKSDRPPIFECKLCTKAQHHNTTELSLFGNPISWSPSNMSQHCPQSIPDSNSESFLPRNLPHHFRSTVRK